jgi:serine/threonine protein phosphatase PrpC
MFRAVTECGGWHVESWELPSGDAGSQDAKLIWPDPRGERVRVAVIDGVTPSARCATVVGVDGAMYASAIVRLALQRRDRPLEECVRDANEHLHDPALARSRDQTQACVTAVDVLGDGRVEVVRAGDCEAWARTEEGWVALGSGTALDAAVAAEWADWQRRNPSIDRAARHDAEERFLGRAEAWSATALGRFARPVIRTFSVRGASELILASDGARLSEPVLEELPDWLAGLRAWERTRAGSGRAGEKVHDDVTVLRLTRLRPALAVAA